MRASLQSSAVCSATFLLAALFVACSDGSYAGTSGASAGSTSNGVSGTATTGGGDTSTAGGSGTMPSGGTGVPGAGTGTTDPTAGVTSGGTGMGGASAGSSMGGSAVAGAAGTAAGGAGGGSGNGLKQGPFKILVLTTTLEFQHDSIPTCNQMLNDLGQAAAPERATIPGLAADATWTVDQIGRDPAAPGYFSEITAENLAKYDLVYSNNPTGPVFTNAPDGANKKQIFQTWIENGGSWAGQHSGTDFENNNRWTWWDDKVAGGWFVDHNGETTPGTINWQPNYINHPILKGLPNAWNTQDEWYIMNRDIEAVPGFQILAKVTTSGTDKFPNATLRPAVWVTENAKSGRSFYTIRGHAQKVYAEPEFRQLMLRGILWAAHRLPG